MSIVMVVVKENAVKLDVLSVLDYCIRDDKGHVFSYHPIPTFLKPRVNTKYEAIHSAVFTVCYVLILVQYTHIRQGYNSSGIVIGVQIFVWSLTAPCHYLNQCWLIIS